MWFNNQIIPYCNCDSIAINFAALYCSTFLYFAPSIVLFLWICPVDEEKPYIFHKHMDGVFVVWPDIDLWNPDCFRLTKIWSFSHCSWTTIMHFGKLLTCSHMVLFKEWLLAVTHPLPACVMQDWLAGACLICCQWLNTVDFAKWFLASLRLSWKISGFAQFWGMPFSRQCLSGLILNTWT